MLWNTVLSNARTPPHKEHIVSNAWVLPTEFFSLSVPYSKVQCYTSLASVMLVSVHSNAPSDGAFFCPRFTVTIGQLAP
jgi:hypothetical protein